MPNRQSTAYGLETTEGIGLRSIHQIISYSDFTDGGSTAGTYNMLKQIPAGSIVIASKVNVLEAFDGGSNSTFTLDIGNSGDPDAYSYTTHNLATAANNLLEHADISAGGTVAGNVLVTSATTVLLTGTVDSDWTTLDAGKIEVWVFYFSTNPE